ncbi:hypothetical protein [Neptunomonas sp.]|uniref:hypothetical protein n=1 Tax=Neptunomonas TaxID=75687 RepID=UPI003511EF85
MRKFLTVLAACCLSIVCSAETVEIDGFAVNMSTQPFVAEDHEITFCGEYVCLIDQQLPFGNDGKLPKKLVSVLVVQFGDRAVELNTDGMFDPFDESSELLSRLSIDAYWGDFYKVTGRFSDGAASYIAQWVVSSYGSSRVFLGSAELLDDLHAQALQ